MELIYSGAVSAVFCLVFCTGTWYFILSCGSFYFLFYPRWGSWWRQLDVLRHFVAGGTAVNAIAVATTANRVGRSVRDGELRPARGWTRGADTVQQHSERRQHGRVDSAGWGAHGKQGEAVSVYEPKTFRIEN